MSTTQIDFPSGVRRLGRQTGYAIAILINLGMLFVVRNVLEWDFLPWLTKGFAEVVPWVSFSLLASIVANLIYEINDARVVKSTGQIGVNLISIVVTYQVLKVFPFDFSSYGFDWGIVVRIVLILAMVGAGIGVVTETIALASNGSADERW